MFNLLFIPEYITAMILFQHCLGTVTGSKNLRLCSDRRALVRRIAELAVEINATQRSSWNLLRRVARTGLELVALRVVLWRERMQPL